MTYKTNSTANRLKITKGWKNPSFPETLTFYSRDNVFFFKIYLFLKAYFNLKRIKLVYCDVRLSENYEKLLYLIINTIPKNKKRKISYLNFHTKIKRGFKYSPLRNAFFKNAKNLLYYNLSQLKHSFQAKLLPLKKKKINKVYYNKFRSNTWINLIEHLTKNRQKWIAINKKLPFNNIEVESLNVQQIIALRLSELKKESLLLNRFFFLLKKKNLLTNVNLNFYKKNLLYLQNKLDIIINVTNQQKQQHKKKQINIDTKSIMNYYKKNNKRKLMDLYKKQYLLNKKLKKGTRIFSEAVNFIKRPKTVLYENNNQNIVTPKLSKKNFIMIGRLNTKKRSQKHMLISSSTKAKIYQYLMSFQTIWKRQYVMSNYRTKSKILKLFHASIFPYSTITQKTWNQLKFKQVLKQIKYKKQFSLVDYSVDLMKIFSKTFKIRSRYYRTKFIFQILKAYRKKKKNLNSYRSFTVFGKNTIDYNNLRSDLKQKIKDVKNVLKKKLKLKKQQLNKNKQIIKKKRLIVDRIQKKKTNPIELRQRFRYQYKNYVKNLTKYQYRLALQELLLKYFKMDFTVKFIQPLSSFKNLKLFRLVYPLYNSHKLNKAIKNPEWKKKKISKKLSEKLRNQYLFVGNAYHTFLLNSTKNSQYYLKSYRIFKINNLVRFKQYVLNQKLAQIPFVKKNLFFYKKLLRNVKKWKYLMNTQTRKRLELHKKMKNNLVTHGTQSLNKYKKNLKAKKKLKKKIKTKIIDRYKKLYNLKKKLFKKLQGFKKNLYQLDKKKDLLIDFRRKQLLDFASTQISWNKRSLMMHSFTPILSLCIKYLNAEILAEHIAKEFEKNKKHRHIINGLSNILRTIKFSRGQGYRIAITGRINSSDKSRVYFLTKKVLVRQNFQTRMNFAYTQARGRIGSFGIKVWIFY